MIGYLTGSTCGDMCWHAREEICRCSCGGANHGILNRGGCAPKRTCKIDGEFYELAGITASAEGECPAEYYERHDAEVRAVMEERFPALDTWAYGAFRQASTPPVVDRKISATQAKWPEVAAIKNARRLIWSRPVGSRYLQKGPNHTAVWNDADTLDSLTH